MTFNFYHSSIVAGACFIVQPWVPFAATMYTHSIPGEIINSSLNSFKPFALYVYCFHFLKLTQMGSFC